MPITGDEDRRRKEKNLRANFDILINNWNDGDKTAD